jgi:hypothetical protein
MPVTLTNPNKIQAPSWLTDSSAGNKLNETYGQLGQFYNTQPLQDSFNQYRGGEMARFEMGADAQSNAAKNHAMLSGGRVGANFSKGALMLGAMGQGNDMAYKFSQLAAQMMAQRAQQQGSLAGNIANYGQGQQQMRLGFTQGQQQLGLQAQESNQTAAQRAAMLALEQQRLAQQGGQFNQSFGLQRTASNDEHLMNQFRLSQAQRAASTYGSNSGQLGVAPSGMLTGANPSNISGFLDTSGRWSPGSWAGGTSFGG